MGDAQCCKGMSFVMGDIISIVEDALPLIVTAVIPTWLFPVYRTLSSAGVNEAFYQERFVSCCEASKCYPDMRENQIESRNTCS